MSRSGHQVSQNTDNFLREKPSTRLHAPPGGGSTMSSLIYGDGSGESMFAGYERNRGSANGASLHRGGRKDEAPEQSNPYGKTDSYHQQQQNYRQAPPAQQQQHHQQYQQPVQQQQQYQQPVQQQQQQQAAGNGRASSNQYATGTNQNAGNVLTDRRITRIHAPPGGASTFRLG